MSLKTSLVRQFIRRLSPQDVLDLAGEAVREWMARMPTCDVAWGRPPAVWPRDTVWSGSSPVTSVSIARSLPPLRPLSRRPGCAVWAGCGDRWRVACASGVEGTTVSPDVGGGMACSVRIQRFPPWGLR